MDSFYASQELINLKYLDQNEIDNYMSKVNEEFTRINKKVISKYAMELFHNSIKDTHRILYKLNNFISSTTNKDFNLGLSILEERCNFLMKSFENLKLPDNDNLNKLLIIYDWFAKEYHPKTIKEEYYDMINQLGIKSKECKNEIVNKFFGLIKKLDGFLKENMKLIEQQDIKDFLQKGYEVVDKISNL